MPFESLLALAICFGMAAAVFAVGKVSLATAFLWVTAAYSTVSLLIFDFGHDVFFGVGNALDAASIARVISWLLLAGVFLEIGGRPVLRGDRSLAMSGEGHERPGLRGTRVAPGGALSQFALVLVGSASALLVIAAKGVSPLVLREGYIIENESQLAMKLADVSIFVSFITAALIRNGAVRMLVVAGTTLTFLGLGSRSTLLFLVGYAFVRKLTGRSSWVALSSTALIALVLGVLILDIRQETTQGLVAVWRKVVSGDFEFRVLTWTANTLGSYSVLVIGDYVSGAPLNWDYFLMSVSPLPSSELDIQGLDDWARFRQYIPHPGFGQMIGHLGIVGLLMAFYGLGRLKRWMQSMLSHGRSRLRAISAGRAMLVEFGLLLPVALSLQYNLRTATRFVFLLVALVCLLALLDRLHFVRGMQRRAVRPSGAEPA